MEYGDLLEIRELLGHQYVIGAVVSLGERPMRYGELGSAMTEWTGNRVGDGEVTRTVNHLIRNGLAAESFVDGHRRFRLTQAGRQRLETFCALGRALRGHDRGHDRGQPVATGNGGSGGWTAHGGTVHNRGHGPRS